MGFPFEAAWQLTLHFGERFPIDLALQQWLDQVRCPLPPLPAHRELIAAADLSQPLSDGRQLLAHQRAGVRWLLARRGAVLADEWAWAKPSRLWLPPAPAALQRHPFAGGGSVGLHDHWRREALALQLSPELLSWARLPQEPPDGGCVLVVDEAHFAQNIQAKRTQALLRLARHPRMRAVWLLTGTPLKTDVPFNSCLY